MLEWDNFGGIIMYYRTRPLSEDKIELIGLFGMRTWWGKSKIYEGEQSDAFSLEELADRLLKQRRKQNPKFNVRPTWAIIRVYQMIKDNLGKKIEPKESIFNLFHEGFYLGELFILLENEGIVPSRRTEFVDFILNTAERETLAQFGEGHWIDHWRYNLDLIENFLYFYPDKKKELFLDTEFLFWDDEYRVKKRIFHFLVLRT